LKPKVLSQLLVVTKYVQAGPVRCVKRPIIQFLRG
jgi:hypothetical protein